MEDQRRELTPEQDALEHIAACRDKHFLEERYIDAIKGRGVFTHKAVEPSAFVVEYRGNIFPHRDTRPRQKRGDTLKDFLFEFSWEGERWCIDASKDNRTLGRLVNDNHISPNCEMKKIVHEGKPHLCLFAVKEISPGEEITYSYGDSFYPWRFKYSDTLSSENSSTDDDDCKLPDEDSSARDSDSFQDTWPSNDTSCTQREDKAASASDRQSLDEGYVPKKAQRKSKHSFFSKKNYCFVCGAGVLKISRHFLKHADEQPEIAEALALDKRSGERKKLLDILRNRGNYKHNQEVLRNNRGELKLKRLPRTKLSAKEVMNCPYCKAMLIRKHMWRHVSRCHCRRTPQCPSDGKVKVLSEIALAESSFSETVSPAVWNLLVTMKPDEIASAIQNDFLLIQLAENLSVKYENEPEKYENIRQRLRELGRLLLALHEKSIFSFEDVVKPKNFDKVVGTVKSLCGFDKTLQRFTKPSLALKLGHSLKKIVSIVINSADGDKQTIRDAKEFLKLCAEDWTELVSQIALASLRKVSNPSTIPFTHDVQLLYRHLETTSAAATESLNTDVNPQAYIALCRVTVAQASVLNKCAPEVSKMTLKAFQERGDTTQVLSKHFIRINILSKAGQNVAVLLTSELVDAITLLVSKREMCGVHRDNPFLFAKPSSSPRSLFHGRNSIRAFSTLCRAKNPEHLRSVNLYKHIARVFQILNLEDDELGHLANLLGHDIRADRDYYQLPEAAVELAKIAKLLLAMEKGSLERFKGNSLEEIEIEDELELDAEQVRDPETDEAEEDNEESSICHEQKDAEEEEAATAKQTTELTPEEDALKHILAREDKPFLEEMLIDKIKGRGVVTREMIEPSTFVVEYRGDIIPPEEIQKKKRRDSLDNYLFDFSYKGTNWRIDASKEDGSLGRLVNDDHVNPNCKMKKIVCEGIPHLCLFAVKQISADEEITYNYGNSSYPWRQMVEGFSSAESCCDDEYLPDVEPSSDDSSGSHKTFERDGSDSPKKKQKVDETDYTSDDYTSEEEPRPLTRPKNYCYVCGKAAIKISRHLFTHRNEEPDIAEVFALPLHSKERSRLLDKLRKKGNYRHNVEVLKTSCGELKVSRQTPNMPTGVQDFALCLYCKCLYMRTDLRRHMQRCTSKKSVTTLTSRRSKVLSMVATAEPCDTNEVPSDVKHLVKMLRKDEIASLVASDPLILQLAQHSWHGSESKTKTETTTQRMRIMGRLLFLLKKESLHSLEEAFRPQNFSKVVEAVRKLAGFCVETKSCHRPSVLLKLGDALRKIGDIKLARALKEDADKETIQEVETLIRLCSEEWGPVRKLGVKNALTVPFIQDAQAFYKYMEKTAASALQSLTLYSCAPVYSALLRVTVAQVAILNKNIEVSRVTLESFNERDETQGDTAVCQLDQIVSKHTVTINGKSDSGRKLVLTLTHKMLAAITLLVSKRDSCGVHKDNPFLFARPADTCTSLLKGRPCVSTLVNRCSANNKANLRSFYFRKHVLRVFQVLDLGAEQLDQLAKLVGRELRTDTEYYQTPEAAVDIARISELLSAVESGTLELFGEKPLEEIEFPDELEPSQEQGGPEGSDAEENNEQSEGSLKSKRSRRKKAAKENKRASSSRKRGRPKGQKKENQAPEQKNEKNDDGLKEIPECPDVKTPEKTLPRTNEEVTKMSFSDDDEDMNVDFDVDTDDDDVGNYKNGGDSDTDGPTAVLRTPDLEDEVTRDDDRSKTKEADSSTFNPLEPEEMKETETVSPVGDEDQRKRQKHEDGRSSSSFLSTEKKRKLSAALRRMKEVKILIPKLDINTLQTPVQVSKLPSVSNSVEGAVKNQRVHNASSKTSAVTDKAGCPKAMQMICSRCKTTMMRGQTAYQKKGFTDVFCSKNCLFEMFPTNKPVAKSCHYCHKAITQPLHLIMAAVDSKGTMKDFCSISCLSSFKSNTVPARTPQAVCSMCNRPCTTKLELTLNEAVHKFCSDSCLEDFRRDRRKICENCSFTFCNKPLVLMLEEETKTVCSDDCLNEIKQKIDTTQQCTMCSVPLLVSAMVHHKNVENVAELFCNRHCVSSYKLQPAKGANIGPGLLKRLKLINKADAHSPAAESNTPTIFIADLCVFCSSCGKELSKGQKLYQSQSSPEVFCSAACLSQRHPNSSLVTKKCYNCFQAIMRPHNIILAPVDDSGTMKELCSHACLSSVNSRRKVAVPKPPTLIELQSECSICLRLGNCKLRQTHDGSTQRICSDACFYSYHKGENLPLFLCDVCGGACSDERLLLKRDDGSRALCGQECLVKFKEKIEALQLCPTCQTSHRMSDMVENTKDSGSLDFFCSNRCMMVHKTLKPFTAPENKSPIFEETDIKEVKPSLANLKYIKEEPIDEEYKHDILSVIHTEDAKDEQKVVQENLKMKLEIDSFFSLTEDSTSTTPTSATPAVMHQDLPASCSNCQRLLIDGATVYQRKGHADIFCSSSCLLKFFQKTQVKKTCYFCLQVINHPQDALQGPVDTEETMKDFCSKTCLSCFNYKKIMATRIPIMPVASQSECSICSRYCISKHEIIHRGVVHKLCSDPCRLRFCSMNSLFVCENCCSHSDTPVVLKVNEGGRKLCSTECLSQFKQKIKTPQPCAMCRSPHLIPDMVENRNDDDEVELFCSKSCVTASKIQAVTASEIPLNCDNCGKTTLPACHLAMSDASIRNFCSLTCAMAFKNAPTDKTQSESHKPPEKLPCAQCQHIIKSTPKIIQKKGKLNFLCSLACSEEFKKANSIMGKCEYCGNERVIADVKRVDDRDCYFCSEGCMVLFGEELEKKWGEHCRSCAYCLSISKTLVTAQYKDAEEEFCSEECNSKYRMLFYNVARCDACGREGKLKQRLPMLEEVKHFCDLQCLLHFCNGKLQMVNTHSSGTVASSPVIANVISLAGALLRQPEDSARSSQPVSVPDIQTKVVGHASVQTVPKQLKNKSLLCTPLVHNKGVSCTTQTADSETQTDKFGPKNTAVPVPVPVYVPVPMNMYSQYTPSPVGLPILLPVPIFVPVTTGDPESVKERGQLEPSEEERNFKSEMKKGQDEKSDGAGTKDGQRQESDAPSDHPSAFNNQEDRSRSLSQPHETPPLVAPGMPSEPRPTLPPPAPPSALEMRGEAAPSPSSFQEVHDKKKKLQQVSNAAEGPHGGSSKATSSKNPKLKRQSGIDAWKRWIQWRESQTNLYLVSSPAVTLNEDVLRCSATELSEGLVCFVTEVKRPDGQPYPPDCLFYLCLSIQKHLLENGRLENIFNDRTYNKFSEVLAKILRDFSPSVTASGYIRSCVEEEFLWDCKQLGAYSPIVLLNTLLFFCCKYFGFTTVEQHHQLSFAHLMCCTKTNQNYTKTTFLRFYPPISVNETDGVPAKKRKYESKENILEILENTENPLRCPVRLYEFYLSKCSETVRQRTDLFYLQPDGSCVPSSPVWFSSAPLDDRTLEAMLVRVLASRELHGADRRGLGRQTSCGAPLVSDQEDSE